MATQSSPKSRTGTKTTSSTSKTSIILSTFPPNPLTTTFSAPADCTGVYESIVWMIDQSTSCLPSTFNPHSTAYYSPGIICPSGYTTACHDTRGISSITTVTCCPFRQGVSLSCVSDPLGLEEIWETMFCTWTPPPDAQVTVDVTLSSNGVTSTTTEVFSSGGINAFGVRMVYQATDLPTSTGGGENTSSTTTDPPSSTVTRAPPTGSPEAGGLSTGAKAAIGVTVPLVVLAVIAVGVAWWWRRRKSGRYNAVDVMGSPRGGDHKKGAFGQGYVGHGGTPPVYELGTPQPELVGDSMPPSELPGHR